MADDTVDGLGAGDEAGKEHANASFVNEFDLTHTVQSEFSPSHSQDSNVQSSVESTLRKALPNMPADSYGGSAITPQNDTTRFDRQSLSRSMSRASSQSTDSVKITTRSSEANNDLSKHTEGIGGTRLSDGGSAQYMENQSSLDSVSDSTLNVPTHALPSNHVPVQINVQDQSPPNTALNGNINTVPNLAAVIPDTGASSHSEYTAKPSETLPAPSATDANSTAKSVPPTPATPAPRVRLPHDKIGILEDRIKEDPRGDLEAWLTLIDEHKKRAKIDDARSVYERFLAVFPSAVSQFFSNINTSSH